MYDDLPARNSTSSRCSHCGRDEKDERLRDLRERVDTFQVIIACASCDAAFTALSRN